MRGPLMAPGDDLVDGGPRSLENCFHTSIGQVAHPSGDAGSVGFLERGLAKPHALHASGDPQVSTYDVLLHEGQSIRDRSVLVASGVPQVLWRHSAHILVRR